jgi:hypothetical protein
MGELSDSLITREFPQILSLQLLGAHEILSALATTSRSQGIVMMFACFPTSNRPDSIAQP